MTEVVVDLFGNRSGQLGFDLGDKATPKSYEPDREEVRRELLEVLQTAKAATDECPWDERTFKYHKVVFPQMANWLPEDERDQMRFEFAQEVERIELLMAA
jgi:hypothetical protein